MFLQKSWKLNHVHCFYLLENGIQRKLVLIPLGARLGLVTQPRYEAPSDLPGEPEWRCDKHRLRETASSSVAQIGVGAAK